MGCHTWQSYPYRRLTVWFSVDSEPAILVHRIDYAICNEGFLTEVLETDIVKMQKQWSDHAAVVVTLKEQPNLPPHPAPALSSCNMKRFIADPRQKKLTALFNKCPNRQVTTIVSDKIVEGLPLKPYFH